MIVLDTHIWVWWANTSAELTADMRQALQAHSRDGLGGQHNLLLGSGQTGRKGTPATDPAG